MLAARKAIAVNPHGFGWLIALAMSADGHSDGWAGVSDSDLDQLSDNWGGVVADDASASQDGWGGVADSETTDLDSADESDLLGDQVADAAGAVEIAVHIEAMAPHQAGGCPDVAHALVPESARRWRRMIVLARKRLLRPAWLLVDQAKTLRDKLRASVADLRARADPIDAPCLVEGGPPAAPIVEVVGGDDAVAPIAPRSWPKRASCRRSCPLGRLGSSNTHWEHVLASQADRGPRLLRTCCSQIAPQGGGWVANRMEASEHRALFVHEVGGHEHLCRERALVGELKTTQYDARGFSVCRAHDVPTRCGSVHCATPHGVAGSRFYTRVHHRAHALRWDTYENSVAGS